LNKYGVKGTYYTSLCFLNKSSDAEPYFTLQNLSELLQDGHEIGCHTFDHLHAEKSSSKDYINSIKKNLEQYTKYFPDKTLKSFSYPFGGININAKKVANEHFITARTNWPGINFSVTDLSLLKANRMYNSENSLELIKELIDKNVQGKGWLIFYTHDVRPNPSHFGCTPEYFDDVVKYSVNSGSVVKTINEAVNIIKMEGNRTSTL
jgi:peptidoglycan/xylan/chitin deacetylase (PgdA/CDA1 family)